MADPGKTMGYEQATGTELSGSKYLVAQGRSNLGEWTDTPDPVFTGSSGVTHVYKTVDGYGTKQFDKFGRRPYSVSIINDKAGDIFFLFEKIVIILLYNNCKSTKLIKKVIKHHYTLNSGLV